MDTRPRKVSEVLCARERWRPTESYETLARRSAQNTNAGGFVRRARVRVRAPLCASVHSFAPHTDLSGGRPAMSGSLLTDPLAGCALTGTPSTGHAL